MEANLAAKQVYYDSQLDDLDTIIRIEGSLAFLYGRMHQHRKSIPILKRVIGMLEKMDKPNQNMMAQSFILIANSYSIRKKQDSALLLWLQKAVNYHKEAFPNEPLRLTRPKRTKALIYSQTGQYEKAIRELKEVLEIHRVYGERNFSTVFGAWHDLGMAYLKNQQPKEAFDAFSEGYKQKGQIFQSGNRIRLLRLMTNQGKVAYELGLKEAHWLDTAMVILENACNLVDSLKHTIRGHLSDESLYLPARRTYEYAIKPARVQYARTGDLSLLEQALQWMDEGKSVRLLESRWLASTDLLHDVPHAQRTKLDSLHVQVESSLKAYALSNGDQELRKAWYGAQNKLSEALRKLKAENPSYYAMRYGRPKLSIEELQNSMKADEQLISCFGQEDLLQVIIVRHDTVFSYEAYPDAAQIQRWKAFLSQPDKAEATLYSSEAASQYAMLTDSIRRALFASGFSENIKHHYVAADGMISGLPLGTLVASVAQLSNSPSFSELSYLILDQDFTYIPAIASFLKRK